MAEKQSEDQSPGEGERIRALGFLAGSVAFVLIEGTILVFIILQIIDTVIDPLLGQLYAVFSVSRGRGISENTHEWILAGCSILLIIGYAFVRERVGGFWPYGRTLSPQFRARLGVPEEPPPKPINGWAIVVVGIVEFMLAFVIALPIAFIILDPVIGGWSVVFWFIAPYGWFAFRVVVALLRDRGPWPYVEKPIDILYYMTRSFYGTTIHRRDEAENQRR